MALAAAIFLLNASLSFESAWPTPGIVWRGALSIELAVLLLGIALVRTRWTAPPRFLGWLAGVWLALVVGHYAIVSATSLYGRDINLFWDLRFVPDVFALLARPERAWVVVLALVGALLALALCYALFWWSLRRIWDAATQSSVRHVIGGAAAAVSIAWLMTVMRTPESPVFSPAVTKTLASQLRLMAASLSGSIELGPSPPMRSDLSLVRGADVFLFFIEAYGAIAFDRPELSRRLEPDRARLESTAHETGRDVVSAYVQSPTFGGSSWLAHISLLSGVEIQTHDANALLMSQKRDTLVTTFRRQGYRTVAMMPGMWQEWPEGRFYGFDEVYGGERLRYQGPPFGWWDMTDQFTLARMDEVEVDRTPRAPLFVLFPTISTHIPFTPTPPYQLDWSRMLTPTPYDLKDVERAYERQPDWLDLGPSYAEAVSYVYQSLTGYLEKQRGRELVMILIGDHQPAAAVSGEGASWEVPVHVIASRTEVLARLERHGFQPGVTPTRPSLGRMHELTSILLGALGDESSAESPSESGNSHEPGR
jgi:hypothetical protein